MNNHKICVLFFTVVAMMAAVGDTRLSYDRPLEGKWEASRLPIGNGRLGAMLSGEADRERIQFNVDSLWTGSENLTGETDDHKSTTTDGGAFGDYQNFGEALVQFESQGITGYKRQLDLTTAVYTVKSGEMFREAFASAPDDVIALRFKSENPFNAEIKLKGAHGEKTTRLDATSLGFTGVLESGLAYAARLDWERPDDRTLIVYLRAKTSYDMARADFGRWQECKQYDGAYHADFDVLKEKHISDYRKYFDRVKLDLGGGAIETMFNFGRYLLISSSRPGTLPANLQGLWNNKNKPAWHSDYHTNINLQMNYWCVNTANLGELWLPVMDFLEAVNRTAEKETRLAYPKSKGIAYRTSVNAFGGGGWKWNFAGAPWMAVMAYDHYRFNGDKEYLEKRVWPFLEQATGFMLTHLVEGPSGELLVKKGWSPEHGPVVDGVMHDQQIMRELLMSVVEAAEVLGKDATEARTTLKKLGGDKIGSWGQLQEWQEDIDKKGDEHRHTSHLFAVYPGTTISRSSTPEFANAAEVVLRIGRTTTKDSRRSWTWPWRAALWARLGNGDKAGEMLDGLLRYNTLPNMFTTHPPFQIDGNLGLVAAVCEMLVQSHEKSPDGTTIVRILPALPQKWANGKVQGLKIRGGGEIDIEWSDGKLKTYTLRNIDERHVKIILPTT